MSHFVTFEGPEGSGKTTQIALLQAYLRELGFRVRSTREPGGSTIGECVRTILHDPSHTSMVPRAEVLLYLASRAQLVDEVIQPALADGQFVLCDRYAESTLAYQGYGRGLDLSELRRINEFATRGLRPDLVVYLDLPAEVGLERKRLAHEREQAEWTRMDQEEVEFHRRVRAGYLAMAEAERERWCVIDAQQPVSAVQIDIRERVQTLLRETGDGGHR